MVLAYAFCNTSLLAVRKEPAHSSEMVNEMLFGERAEILEINDNDWAKIKVEWDNYIGWCRVGQLSQVSKKEYWKENRFITASHNDRLLFENGSLWLPLGSDLRGIKGGKAVICTQQGKFKGKRTATNTLELTPDNFRTAAFNYLHAPYLWGGRSVAGIDCSGLTQMAFKLCGKAIPRDASQQAELGETVDFLTHAQCGDLAFFGNPEGKINHVGILLDGHSILHATDTAGRVLIDKIDPEGIVSTVLRKRTHALRLIKRYF